MEKIKLVIWDLDDTFWKGTLSEEGIQVIQRNIDLVKTLTDRGIINSIVSKNDYEKAKDKLIELGVWEYFVFPSIEWTPKGSAIKNIIEQCQLRDVNVLFLDDNHLNLNEARFYNPNLHAEFPDFIDKILTHKAFKGKDDTSHSRLQQYKILEKKASARREYDDNLKFLESSNIRIEFLKEDQVRSNIERLAEILERTNQLNFTKIRSNRREIEALLNDEAYESSLIRVRDNFGDYGLVGFYALHRKDHHLRHFVFSCRIINLGIPQYVYSFLDFPSLEIIPEVVEKLDRSTPHWISRIESSDPVTVPVKHMEKSEEKKKIFFKGGCDLSQMLFYLKEKDIEVHEETNYVGKNNLPIHQEHSIVLLDCVALSMEDIEFIQQADFIPFTDENFYNTSIFDADYDCLIFSVLMDYSQQVFRHRSRNILLPFGGYYNVWTDEKDHEAILRSYQKRNIPLTRETLERFSDEFEHIGQIRPEEFTRNLAEIRKAVPPRIPIIFINGAELESPIPSERAATQRHILMNAALERFIRDSDNTYLLDVREVVDNQKKIHGNIRHYNRESYKALSVNLLSLLNEVLNEDISAKLSLKMKLLDRLEKAKISFVKPIRYLKNTFSG
jgi:FkbH-like protein